MIYKYVLKYQSSLSKVLSQYQLYYKPMKGSKQVEQGETSLIY